jgi:8-hydroxy-5-deazaflavin:NADPH oxidoreductase
MKIGVLGSGDVGKVLAAGFAELGHEVVIGTRDPKKLAAWQPEHPAARVGTFDQAAAFGEVVVLAVRGAVAAEALRGAGAANLAGKPILDATNPIAETPPTNAVLHFFTTLEDSLLERLQREFPEARFVKAFNSVGNRRMVQPRYAEGRPTMFICGNDPSARKVVGSLAGELGWDVADMGTAEAARAIEPLCILWCIPGFTANEWTHAFKLLH